VLKSSSHVGVVYRVLSDCWTAACATGVCIARLSFRLHASDNRATISE
jgi:hypothetical protein